MIPLNASEPGAALSRSGAAESRSYAWRPSRHVRADPVDFRFLASARDYLRQRRRGHESDPAMEAAWWAFFESLVPLIRSYARICRCSPANIDDGIQEVCIVLIRHLPNYRHDGAKGRFHDWLFVVVRRTLGKMRKRERRFRLDTPDREEFDRRAGREDDPAVTFEHLERVRSIRDALDDFHAGIDPVSFRIVELHWIEGLSVKDVARELRVSPGRIRGCLMRTKKTLRGCFERRGIAATEK